MSQVPLATRTAALHSGAVAAADPQAGSPPIPADLELIEKILRETHVDTSVQTVSVSGYLVHLWKRLQEAIADFFAWASSLIGNWGDVLLWTGRILVAAAVAAVALGLGVLLWRTLNRKGQPAKRVAEEPGTTGTDPPRAAVDWRAEIEGRLAGGAVKEALEAIWWWLARSLAGDRAQASWTSRELDRQARRPELSPLLRRLDAMIYGAAQPSVASVRGLVDEAEATL